ncbi:Phasin protein [Gemmobacter aquatilis]|uniref:Phasin protein n=1 Tax=Gemmobacter aquatilis TaxID=933059 RepID=A0A1H7ZYS0_9RHOB|nr:phasin family protein [Gemmobacter aquatilis]SEM63812.1 Phasin protein [Gemmobacter aquatilis]
MAAKSQKTPMDAMAALMPGASTAAVSALIRPQAKMMEALLKQNIEVLAFMRARYERDLGLVSRMADATESGEVMSLWSEFWQRTLADYGTETNKLAASVSEIAQQAVRSATEEAAAVGATIKPKS